MKLQNWKRLILTSGALSFPLVVPFALVACGDDGITQANVDAEQKIINALGGAKKYETTKPLGLVTNATFTNDIAIQFRISGFVPKSDFTYLYSHPILDKDGQLSLTILVKTDRFTSTNAVPHLIEVTGLDTATNAQAILDTVDATKIGNLDKTKLPSDIANANPTINGVTGIAISNKTPKDEENAYELEISVSVNGKTFKKTIVISGFPQTANQIISALGRQGANADTQQKWEAYVELLGWANDSDKQRAKGAIDWSGSTPIVKAGSFLQTVLSSGFNIPSTVTSIGDSCFLETTLPESFVLPSTIIAIHNSAFGGAKVASNFRLPSSIETIGDSSFVRVELPEGFTIPSSVKVIKEWAFSQAKLQAGFIIPSSVTSIVTGNEFSSFWNVNIGNLRWVYLDANGQPDSTRLAPGPVAGTALVV